MRAAGYTLHQSLTLEAVSVVKQAVSLARRRGHAQVTPLHVVSAMLASSTGLLRRACLQSHAHPFQCKALELCFNVALNRLPTSAPTPLLGPQCHIPSLSNALVAAFKRAQAHQRRGSIENQQQPILALKVEVEQLVISILDDPSISRVMREAGFSSDQVKSNVEKAISLEKHTSQTPTEVESKEFNTKAFTLGKTILSHPTPSTNLSQFKHSSVNNTKHDDVITVFEAMMNARTKNVIIVSDSPATAESLVKEVIQKFDKKDVPSDMKYVQFISVPLSTLRNISREEFKTKLTELQSLVKSYVNRGVVLYLGDLDWISNFWSRYAEQRDGYYNAVEYMIMELSRLICVQNENNARLWLMGIATQQTYEKCRIGRPSLETLWSLHPIRLPVGLLALGLSLESTSNGEVKKEPIEELNWMFQKARVTKMLICCSDCADNFKREAQSVISAKHDQFVASASSSSLPLWLQQYKNENQNQKNVDQEYEKMRDLSKKWNSICTTVHRKTPHFLVNLSSPSPSPPSSTSTSSNNLKHSELHQSHLKWAVTFNERGLEPKENQIFLHENDVEVSKPELLSNPNSSPNSASSSEASHDLRFLHKFKEFNSDNLTTLSTALEKKVPWLKDIIPDIVTTILNCRSGQTRPKREDTWLLFSGPNHDNSKETIARELANAIFGSYDSFIALGVSCFSSNTRVVDSSEEVSNKRARSEHGGSAYDRLLDAMSHNSSRVFYVEDADLMVAIKGLKRTVSDGEAVLLKDAIIIFSCESESKAEDEDVNKEDINDMREEQQLGPLDLNIDARDDGNGYEKKSVMLDLVDKEVVFKIKVL